MAHPDLGNQLNIWRKYVGLSQAVLEQKAGLGHNTVSRIERGESSPTTKTLEKLASALNALKISYEQLILGSPKNKNNSPKSTSYKKRIIHEVKKLTESECKELYPVWERIIDFAKRREEG
jgi:transcriptional regulator with XRE-family HTH domain